MGLGALLNNQLWPMAKLVVKQSAKAHGPLVFNFLSQQHLVECHG